MYSCNWMFNVTEAGTYVIDTQTTTTFTIVSALVKYYDTTKPDISTCTVRLNSASSVSGIINETLQNKDVVIVQNVPFTITGGGELYLYTTAAVSLMLSVISTETRPAPGPIPVKVEIKNCKIRNPPWWEKFAYAKDNYPQFTSRTYYFTSDRTSVQAGLTDYAGNYSEYCDRMWNNSGVNILSYQGNVFDLWSLDPYPTFYTWAESYGRRYMQRHILRRVDVTSGGLPKPCFYRWELWVEIRLDTSNSDNLGEAWKNANTVLNELACSDKVTREVSPTELVFKDHEGYEYRIYDYKG